MNFKKQFFSRWVLCGEHSVLRGGEALVYPLFHYSMSWDYRETEKDFEIELVDSTDLHIKRAILQIISLGLTFLNKERRKLKGDLSIKNFIPFGAGLGGSAVLSVAVSSLFNWKGWLPSNEMGTFAASLENFFHGKSSGMDIYAVLKGRPLLYQKGTSTQSLPSPYKKNQPLLFLSDSGEAKSTKTAISQVEALWEENSRKAERVDKQMEKAVSLAKEALYQKEREDIRDRLKQSIDMAENCFRDWGLIRGMLSDHIEYLKDSGALAVKPSGAGLGGFVISLWDQPPSSLQKIKFIPLSL